MAEAEGGSEQDDVSFLRTVSTEQDITAPSLLEVIGNRLIVSNGIQNLFKKFETIALRRKFCLAINNYVATKNRKN
ncbi:GM20809 [Drosophila sechellia]|uniref:GM20809 n=1 Tax=Drosophila sechellia TaxID=7238 RepID=B4IQB0_DROSE|nr:GM20809 [Drosophila sechellia]